ncbi:MAG: hypothetical protein CVV44_11355 [Spirochaetae bacterium HGW-Spirochaetae-1]|jgi:hypothetical protein|nr:MAG: hypothetical protein CVV44_11355 [Spirochaetae bacterium HGW-Spirochaetae-1]
MKPDLLIKDYYGMLGIARDASPDEIRAAFRKAARLTHPDATGDTRSYNKFILIREAYDILSDKTRKREYDSLLFAAQPREDDSADQFQRAFSDFTVSGEPYRHEWEYFVRHPDDYLDLFDSIMKALLSSALSALAGLVITLLVFLAIFILLPLGASAAILLLGLSTAGSPEPLVLLIMAVHLFSMRRKLLDTQLQTLVKALAGITVRPLRGIPRKTGRWFIYFNYCAALSLFILSGCSIALWITGRSVPYGHYGTATALLLSTALVILFAVSIPLSFNVIREALFNYPVIRWSRFTVASGGSIEYTQNKYIPR